MFRRKEGEENTSSNTSLFGNTDSSQNATESANVVPPSSASGTGTSSMSNASTQTSPTSTSSPMHTSSPTARPIPERAVTPPTATAFRPSANSIGGDMVRNRMPEPKAPMAAPSGSLTDKNKGGRRVLTVGNDILLKGEIATCDRLVIEGKVDATLNDVHTVEIAETGSFKGSANIEDAEISGLFEGDLVVRNRLIIYATGKVRGKISYGEVEIERGGELTGEIKITNAQVGASRPTRSSIKENKDDKVAA